MFFKSAKYRKSFLKSLLFVLPGVIITLVFVIYPVINTAWLSLNSWNGIGGSPIKWVGLQNYIKTLTSVKFWNSMLNALYFVIGGFVILMPIAFGLALLVTSKLKGTKFFKAAYLMPVMLGTTAVGLMWSFMLNANFGVLAQFLKAIGHSEWIINWLATPTVNIWCVVLVNEWMYAGYNMLIFAAGIVAIPDDVHEAALLDGCTGIKKIIYIQLPLLMPTITINLFVSIAGAFKAFDIPLSLTGGGPANSTQTIALNIYNDAFGSFKMGYGSAKSIILFLLVGIIALIQLKITRKREVQM